VIYTAQPMIAIENKPLKPVLHSKFPSTIELLCLGGDDRISLGENSTVNKYGCTPYPNANLVSFSSSTASVISEDAFSTAEDLHDSIMLALEDELPVTVYTNELNRIKRDLLRLCSLDDITNLEVIFGASGTDLHLIAAQLTPSNNNLPLLAIMPDVNETGSGVSAALTSCHFGNFSALGKNVTKGLPVKYTNAVDVVSVSMRCEDGNLRSDSIVDAEIESLVDNAAKSGQSVLLILVDTSKTGLISPSPACAIKLKNRYPSLVNILVDACQFRISSATLRAYLEQDFMVMITGSKFLTGPVFCGALLVPKLIAKEMLSRPIPMGLSTYSSRAEWPENCVASQCLKNDTNFGLLLRWQAALEELRQFRNLSDLQIKNFTQRFANAIQNRLKSDDNFSQVSVRPLNRQLLVKESNWDEIPTVFTFMLFRDGKNGLKQLLTLQETLQIYQWLQLNPDDAKRPDIRIFDSSVEVMQCQLGQPVVIGNHEGQTTCALRLCLSARLVVKGVANNGRNGSDVIQSALSALDNVSLLIKELATDN
jgi:hypothetical protein